LIELFVQLKREYLHAHCLYINRLDIISIINRNCQKTFIIAAIKWDFFSWRTFLLQKIIRFHTRVAINHSIPSSTNDNDNWLKLNHFLIIYSCIFFVFSIVQAMLPEGFPCHQFYSNIHIRVFPNVPCYKKQIHYLDYMNHKLAMCFDLSTNVHRIIHIIRSKYT